ncbi:DEAD/DEAH box helicase [Arabidopsis thaliana]|uniref:DExH-box ATP-dependent RNA helicase DExH15 chloroplastic n=1 Tax=Arabidopsis thaliana TaxID=3702 RepID=ISE2_ARATH|nr:DEAD/DEAH box helicase [Arabidopsis thaliana]B9DFG3.2 RecName: Full=DExH-box ATP-dependent RNA helicase DExH15 chloroplastic; AltName: Full=ATP-dependent RNA helicase ISE2; AltName: Full=Protein EMBRYO DEFECTIVE 25; AltName: Full=Protein INCREASED SIZE EXCLUSION LIMIT 2; AltName: Full=Protein PIGMENT DEFECTIVE 317; Flags: Precursor [Arabidopsis thaliana]AEE35013.1 DEAD/DEAH box helicase [Arabidopsis thaliana]|eukprot:NP_177164.1 DEAD/DEAH box helicase [Arabidopsis thaliana]
MNTLPVVSLTASSSFKFFHFPSLHRSLSHSPNFSFTKSLILNPNHLSFKSTLNSLSPSQSQLYEEEDDEEEEEEDEDDDDEAADEYDNISDEIRNSDDDDDDEETEFSVDLPTESARERVEFRWQRVEKLRSLVRDFGVEMIDIDELISIYDFRIDKFQRLAIEAFLRGSSVVVSAPTSSGKTLIAEAAAVSTVAKGRRLFYTTPLKALSNQKFREFRETFGDDNVGLLTGDSAINKDAQIVIMTTEILRNMLYQSVGMASSGTGLFHVDAIVLDEVHYLSDISRGTVWEEIVIYCPKEVQLICLSATVANPDELAGWIGEIHGKTELVTSTRRPVPLTWYFSTKHSLLPLLDEKGINVNRKLSLNYLQLSASEARFRDDDDGYRKRRSKKRGGDTSYNNLVNVTDYPLSKNEINKIRRSQVPQISDTLWHLQGKNMLPAIWFIFNRRGCDAAVQYVENFQLLDDCEKSEVELALKKFRVLYPDAVRESAEKGLLRGIAAHHAGCLPLWKSFIEELFQRGLVKVVFATETLAAGINMPARTAVISSLSKKAGNERIELGPNELYQMAGRAGRRGIDEKGYTVLVQTAFEGAEECCKLVFAGVKPLVSQFTASYGMVLNLVAGSKVTRKSSGTEAGKVLQAGRSLEEAKKLVEKSFGNYVSSNVTVAAKQELAEIDNKIEILSSEISDEAIDKKSRKLLSARDYKEITVLKEELREEKRKRAEQRRRMELERFLALKPLLKGMEEGNLPFICLEFKDSEGREQSVPAVYLGHIDSFQGSKLQKMMSLDESFALNLIEDELAADEPGKPNVKPSYYVALGSDNSWYLFTEKWVRTVYRTGFPNIALALGDALPREIMKNLLDKADMQWDKLAESELGSLWRLEGSLETWSWSLNVPVLSSLSDEDEVLHMSEEYDNAAQKYKEQRSKISRLKKKMSRSEGFREYKKILENANLTVEKMKRLKARSRRLINRLEQIEPSGWKDFMRISNVIHESRALDINTHLIFPLGETAAAIRGENELWLAMVLRNKALVDLKPPQLAGVCASLVSEGIKVRPWRDNNYIYEPSDTVVDMVNFLEDQRSSLIKLQEKHEVMIPCCLDVQFSGMVEAWASGLSWKEMMMECAMDEGDLARLLRRTIDLLAQIPKLPDIDPVLQRSAAAAADIMDRPPISELAG